MSLSGSGCATAVDKSLGVVRAKAQTVVDKYVLDCEEWAAEQERYLADLKEYLNGNALVEPESPGPPPAVPDPSDFPTPGDYSKAFGEGFLKYICDNVSVKFSWSGTGVDSSSGSTISDPSFLTGFTVSGAAGGGVLAGPGKNDVSKIDTFLGNLSALASGLVVTLPLEPGKSVFIPSSVVFKAGAKLEADPSSHVDSDNPGNTSYLGVLEGVCAELISSFKSNFKSQTSCVHMAQGTFPNVPAGFSGTATMDSIS